MSTGSVGIYPPTAGNYTLTMPQHPGLAGQVLTTNGTGGILTWSTAAIAFPVLSPILGSSGAPVYSFNSDPNTGMYAFAADALSFVTNGSDRMIITPAGSVGLGTSTPNHRLSIRNTTNQPTAMEISTGGAGALEQTSLHLVSKSSGGASLASSSVFGWEMTAYGDMYGAAPAKQNYLEFLYYSGAVTAQPAVLTLGTNGNVSLGGGTPNIAYKLNVSHGTHGTLLENISSNIGTMAILTLHRKTQNTNAPGPAYVGALDFTAEGFTNNTVGTVGRAEFSWELGQANNTTDRDGYLSFQIAKDNSVTERMRLTSSGTTFIGNGTMPTANVVIRAQSESPTTNLNPAALELRHYKNGQPTTKSAMILSAAEGSFAGPSALAGFGTIGVIQAQGYEGGNFVTGAQISFVNGQGAVWSGSDHPTNIVFSTTPQGFTTPTPRMTIGYNGSVGIGTIATQALLEVAGSIKSGTIAVAGLGTSFIAPPVQGNYTLVLPAHPGTPGQILRTAGTSGVLDWTSVAGASFPLLANSTGPGAPEYSFGSSSNIGMFMPNIGTLGFSTNGTERVRITAEGSVGIGLGVPQARLDVAGDIRVGNQGVSCSSTNQGSIRYNAGILEYCDANNQWQSTIGIKNCPSGFTLTGGNPGTRSAFCIHTSIQSSSSFVAAASTCNGVTDASLGNAHLCTTQEFIAACHNLPASTLTASHWVNQVHNASGNYAAIMTDGGAQCTTGISASYSLMSSSFGYRCCFSK